MFRCSNTISGLYCSQTVDDSTAAADDDDPIGRSEELQRIAKALALSVAYGANIGGIATLTGTPPNLVLKQQADKYVHLNLLLLSNKISKKINLTANLL